MTPARIFAFTGLKCTECHTSFGEDDVLGRCPKCDAPLDTVLDEEYLKEKRKQTGSENASSMWRFRAFLPVRDDTRIVTAGEGGTQLRKLSSLPGHVWLKDESRNPTGSFKDRGASLAVTKALQLGMKRLVLSSEGNAGCSFALYSGIGRISCSVFLPKLANASKVVLTKRLGATVTRVTGTIADAGRRAESSVQRNGGYNASTFITPYRHDGKGTIALEICEQLGWRCPDWIVYPLGGGVGLVGMWKMFKILENIGWVTGKPRLVAVQPAGCAPIVKAFSSDREDVEEWRSPKTSALGLKIPKPLAGRWILKTLRESHGVARAVTEDDIRKSTKRLARDEGVLLEPSSAAAFAALPGLYEEKLVDPSEQVVVIGTGSGLKTLESL
ncbi:MAG: hypothetical protein AUJ07_08470 [Crenarchaeota archaeon 13_1_40CM_3_53_5]|nr:MAG: hypothetical protein AUJ07_08470 [Crenarchaeota archaeon 13_1_40CM_3_53_5]